MSVPLLSLGPPRAADPGQAERLVERLLGRLAGMPAAEAVREWLDRPAHRALLEGIFGCSPFLSECLLLEPGLLGGFVVEGPTAVLERLIRETETVPLGSRGGLMRDLRILRRRVALLAALADLSGQWDLEAVTGALTRFADAAVMRTVDHLLAEGARQGELALADPEHPGRHSGIVVLAMGKLGAFELNYSSDIDLIVLFDGGRFAYTGGEAPMAFAVRLARTLAYLLEKKTADGYVFRTDLRLRPHLPGHPLALSCEDAELYYERHGQNWERAAFIKARPVAGDIDAGAAFLERLRPYVWRKHLDFAAIRDVHSIKRQIHAHHGFGDIRVLGHDLKLGRGGIREIEFFVQTQQLILGGRHPELRTARTREALRRLAAGRWISEETAAELDAAYVALRSLEHRLQMLADRQTQRLPAREAEFARFAAFAGIDDAALLERRIRSLLETVERHYAALFESEPELGAGRRLVFTGAEDDPETLDSLREMGFRNPAAVSERIRSWHHGHIRATRSARARELLTELTPSILESLARQPDVDEAFRLFDEFISTLPAGVQIFSLLHAHPRLLVLLADLMGAAPRLARHLSRHVDLFESMLAPDFFEPLADAGQLAAELAGRLADARHLEEVLDLVRRWAHGRQFQAGLHVLLGVSDIRAAERALTAIAEVVLQTLLPRAMEWLAARHGALPEGRFAILGLGKLGSRELTIGSDLDLVFVYEAPEEARSDGDQPLPARTYYARLAQRLISAISAATAEGSLYEIDMRLRPSGNVGPVACSLASFVRYHRETSAIWELQALTRARPVAGDEGLSRRIAQAIDEVLCRPRDAARVASEIAAMRARIFRQHGSGNPWNVKHVRGGIIDLEFIAQYLHLVHAEAHPEIRTTATRELFERAAEAGILEPSVAGDLVAALDLQHAVQAVLRLSASADFEASKATPGIREALLRAANRACPDGPPIESFEVLAKRLETVQSSVRDLFESLCPAAPGRKSGGKA